MSGAVFEIAVGVLELPNTAQAQSLVLMTDYPCFKFPSVDLNETAMYLIFSRFSDLGNYSSLNNFFLLL